MSTWRTPKDLQAAKDEFVKKLQESSDEELRKTCSEYQWLSAYANNNPKSDYHWKVDCCYDECKARNKVDGIYTAELNKHLRNAG